MASSYCVEHYSSRQLLEVWGGGRETVLTVLSPFAECSPPQPLQAEPGGISPSCQEGRFVLWQFLHFTNSGILMPQGQQVPGSVPPHCGRDSPPRQA